MQELGLSSQDTPYTPPKYGSIKDSDRYYKTKDMHLFGNVVLVYKIVAEHFIQQKNPDFTKNFPEDVALLGGFYPDRKNIDAFQDFTKKFGFLFSQLRYLDFNSEPKNILRANEKDNFRQLDLKNIATQTDQNGEVIIKTDSVKMIVLDHVTEFMDDESINQFFDGLVRVLTENGVALMAVMDVKVKLWHKVRGFLSMRVKTHPRTSKEWIELINTKLKIACQMTYPVDNRKAILFVLSKKSSPYEENLIAYELDRDDLIMYDLSSKAENAVNPQE